MTALEANADPSGSKTPPSPSDLATIATAIGETAAKPAAASVDRDARFPSEAIDALRRERMLSVLVPRELGGAGASIAETAAAVEALGRHCASTSMVYAMHQIQVHCLVRHGATPALDAYLRELAANGVAPRVGDDRDRDRRRHPLEQLCTRAARRPVPPREAGAR